MRIYPDLRGFFCIKRRGNETSEDLLNLYGVTIETNEEEE
jgi:hypothetical protein